MTDDAGTETGWNMAMLFYGHIAELIKTCSEMAINDNLLGWFRACRSLQRKVQVKFSDSQIEELDKKYFEIKKKLSANLTGIAGERAAPLLHAQITELLDDYESKIIKIADRYNMIIPNIKVTYGLEKIKARYN